MKFFNKLFKKEEKEMAALEVMSEVVTDSVYDAVTEAIRQEPVIVKEEKPEWVKMLEETAERIAENNRKNLIQLN